MDQAQGSSSNYAIARTLLVVGWRFAADPGGEAAHRDRYVPVVNLEARNRGPQRR